LDSLSKNSFKNSKLYTVHMLFQRCFEISFLTLFVFDERKYDNLLIFVLELLRNNILYSVFKNSVIILYSNCTDGILSI